MPQEPLRIESASADVHHLAVVGTLAGVAPLLAAARNGPGMGRLSIDVDGLLAWRAPGSATFGLGVDCTAGGEFVLTDGETAEKWIRVHVYPDYIVDEPAESDVFLADRYNEVGGDDATAEEAEAGDVADRELTLRNTDGQRLANFRVWLNPAADTRQSIGWNGVDYYSPTTEEDAIMLDLLDIDEEATLHLRRAIVAVEPSTPKQLVQLHIAFDQV